MCQGKRLRLFSLVISLFTFLAIAVGATLSYFLLARWLPSHVSRTSSLAFHPSPSVVALRPSRPPRPTLSWTLQSHQRTSRSQLSLCSQTHQASYSGLLYRQPSALSHQTLQYSSRQRATEWSAARCVALRCVVLRCIAFTFRLSSDVDLLPLHRHAGVRYPWRSAWRLGWPVGDL